MDTITSQVTRYNYKPEEKTALVELIAMIKSLQSLMSGLESRMDSMVKRHVYHQLQTFVQTGLRESLRKARKHKREDKFHRLGMTIACARQICADWENGVEPTNDPIMEGKKDPDPLNPFKYNINRY